MYEVLVNTNVNKAILVAGDQLIGVIKNNVKLLRVQRNGEVKVQKLSYNDTKLTRKNKRTSLRNGDIIQVNKNILVKQLLL